MKLGYVVKTFPRLSETFILTELLGLQRRGVELTVFARYRPEQPVPHEILDRLDVEVIYLDRLLKHEFWKPFDIHRRLTARFPERHDAALSDALRYRSRKELKYWMLAGAVAEEAHRRGLDGLHAHFATGSASVARYASAVAGIPFSMTAHAKDIYADAVDRQRLADLIRAAAGTVTVSDANVEFLQQLVPEGRIVRVYNGLDLDRFEALPRPPEGDPPMILSVSRMVEKKGLADLIDAVAILDACGLDLRCRLVGDGPLRAELLARVQRRRLTDRFEWVGEASQEQVIDEHLPSADVFALPCVVAADGDRDGLPTTLLESMARGVPVVSSRLPGVPEAVPHDVCGLLSDPGDVKGLSYALKKLLEDREATRRRARQAREHVEDLFDSRRNVGQLLGHFQAWHGRSAVTGGRAAV